MTAGLHGSASTGLFNIVRELMVAVAGAGDVLALYGEDLSALPAPVGLDRRHVVLKSHAGSAQWQWLVGLSGAPVVLSIRDPRDCVLSLMQRFGMAADQAVRAIVADCRLATVCAEAGHVPFRYEDRFFEDETMARQLAARLGLEVAEDVCRAIGRRYTMAGVRTFAGALPAGRVVKTERLHFDPVTQIHATHIGDGAVGKWRHLLSPADGDALTQVFAPFLARFGYDAHSGRKL